MSPGDALDRAAILRVKARKMGLDLSLDIGLCLSGLNGHYHQAFLAELEALAERGWDANEAIFAALVHPDPETLDAALDIIANVRTAHESNVARIRVKNGINEHFGHPEREVKSWL